MPRGRPKGSKNKKTLQKLKQQSSQSIQSIQNIQSMQKGMDTTIEQNTHFVQKLSDLNEKVNKVNKLNGVNESYLSKHQKSKSCKSESEYLHSLSDKQLEKFKTCRKCGGKIISDPYRVDTNLICGLVSTHRLHPRYVELCKDCAKALSDLVDNWLGENYPTKWENNEGGY